VDRARDDRALPQSGRQPLARSPTNRFPTPSRVRRSLASSTLARTTSRKFESAADCDRKGSLIRSPALCSLKKVRRRFPCAIGARG
jgi:hypothetical protein